MQCIPISEPAVSSNQLTQGQKPNAITDSCQQKRTLSSGFESEADHKVHNTFTQFKHSAQSTPPGY